MGVLAIAVLLVLWRRDIIRPGSFARRARPEPAAPGYFYLILALVAIFAQAAASVLVLRAGSGAVGEDGGRVLSLGAAYAVAITLMLWGLRAIEPGAGWLRLPERPARASRSIALSALLGALALLPVAISSGTLALFIARHALEREPDTIAHDTLRQLIEHRTDPWTWGAVALAVLVAPIAEELLFRVLIQSALVRGVGSRWGAIILTSLLFAAIHLGGGVKAGEAYALLPILIVGLGCGIAYERTGRATVAILLHVAYNAANVLLALALA